MQTPMTFQDDFAGLETDIVDGQFCPPVREARGQDAKTVTYPCTHCGGTGNWRGRGKCYACGGKGHYLTSEREREKARTQHAASKAKKLTEARAAFDEQYPDVAAALSDAALWSPFAAEFAGKLAQYGSLTEPQVLAIRRMMERAAEKRAERDAKRHTGDSVVDLTPIRAMFETAVGSGYKRPIYRAAGLVISRAPSSGKNPGALYVKTEEGDYLGKIVGTQYAGRPADGLSAIAADPRGEAVKHGQRTGTCACCGATLTNRSSIKLGIGPICAAKWGLAIDEEEE